MNHPSPRSEMATAASGAATHPPAGDPCDRDLLHRLPVTARTVLEMGCGTGALGAAFKAIQPDCLYVGVERSGAAASLASTRLDRLICWDDEAAALSLPELPPLDVLVLGNAPALPWDPRALLSRQAKLLAEDGQLLAVLPNLQHCSLLEQLLRGQTPPVPGDGGGAASLSWCFTREGIASLIAASGLHLLELHPRSLQREQAEALVARLEPALAGLGLDRGALLAATAPQQYLVRASRRPRPPLQLDAMTLRPQAGMVDVRMAQPLRAVASLGAIGLRLRHDSMELLPPESPLPRLLIWQRPSLQPPEAHLQLRRLIRNGYVVVVEYDDDPAHWPAIAATGHLVFTGVHAVQVSTEVLAAKIRRHNPEVAVFGNALDALPPPRPAADPASPLRLFFGALNREADWAPWIDTLNATLLESPERWQVEVVHDRAFFDALRLPARRFTPTCDYATYRRRLAGCDIAFLPLADTPFNRCKSDLKAVEASGHGLAVLASPVVYGDSLRQGETARFFSSSDELRQVLQEWQRDPAAARAMGERARRWVASCRLQHHQAAARETWYRSLWERRAQLAEQLLRRVPELASSAD